eukprot:TRINITY_DN44789_c0_g1_i2.p1 TRINITY_DN44789_c0_g1~~TRINITY_DN44789_c0_g1_i2.p1  ORF type:complete len:195 (-),score=64.51 TRINITY_DN44789_c0_g1_i2:270-854(-)
MCIRDRNNLWANPKHRMIKPGVGDVDAKDLEYVSRNNVEITLEQCELLWTKSYQSSLTHCTHGPKCPKNAQEEQRAHTRPGHTKRPCTYGLSTVTKRMLAGSLLPVWDCIAPVLNTVDNDGQKKCNLHISRVECTDGQRLVGVELPDDRVRVVVLDKIAAKAQVDAEMGTCGHGDMMDLDVDSEDEMSDDHADY